MDIACLFQFSLQNTPLGLCDSRHVDVVAIYLLLFRSLLAWVILLGLFSKQPLKLQLIRVLPSVHLLTLLICTFVRLELFSKCSCFSLKLLESTLYIIVFVDFDILLLLRFDASKYLELPLILLDLRILNTNSILQVGQFFLRFGADPFGTQVEQHHLIHVDLFVGVTELSLNSLYTKQLNYRSRGSL